MKMNSSNTRNITPECIAKLLTHAAQRLDDKAVAALHQARDIALDRQLSSKPVSVMSTEHGLHWLMPHSAHQWVTTVILLAAILFGGLSFWQHDHENDLAHLDAAILTDDMPLEIFVD